MIEIPEDGDRVRVVGAWVTDEDAGGWNEIHPAWKVEVLDRNSIMQIYFCQLKKQVTVDAVFCCSLLY
jgi:hypothetical protein